MGIGNSGVGGFKTKSGQYRAGFGVVVDLAVDLPLKYDVARMGLATEKGYVMDGWVYQVIGCTDSASAPVVREKISVLLRPNDVRKDIFADLEKTREGVRFLLEGVTISDSGAVEARWAHGAGTNRVIEACEIVGPAHLSFENPIPSDGPKNGWLHLNLDGSPTTFDKRGGDGAFVSHELLYQDVLSRLQTAMERNLKFRVSQRVLYPTLAVVVDNQLELEGTLTALRHDGHTACVVRTFVVGTTDPTQVDVQLMSWPTDVPADGVFTGITYDMPVLADTKRFVGLRDGEAEARMEVIPGEILNLVGNSDTSKSTKHGFVRNVLKGLSDGQKNMYAMQNYGPGIAVLAALEDGDASGMVRLALRTDGPQYGGLITIPSPNFVTADKIKFVARGQELAA